MAFKMKNQAVANMAKMAGDNRSSAPMKMKSPEDTRRARKEARVEKREERKTKKHAKRLGEAAAAGVGARVGAEVGKKLSRSAMKLDDKKKGEVKEGSYTTHGNPSKYTTAAGKSVSSANIDEGNLSAVKKGSDGRKFVTVQDDTAKFKAGTKLYIK